MLVKKSVLTHLATESCLQLWIWAAPVISDQLHSHWTTLLVVQRKEANSGNPNFQWTLCVSLRLAFPLSLAARELGKDESQRGTNTGKGTSTYGKILGPWTQSRIYPFAKAKTRQVQARKLRMTALCLDGLETVCDCQSWDKHTHLRRTKLIKCYKLLETVKSKKYFKISNKLLHLARHVLLQGCDQIALLFPNRWHRQAINKQVQDVHWYHRQHLLAPLSFTYCSPFLMLSWLSSSLQA